MRHHYFCLPSEGGCLIQYQGLSRVMTRLHHRVGSIRGFQNLAGRGRVGSLRFEISRVGSGRAKRFQNLAGRVRSGQYVSKSRGSGRVGSIGFKISRVGSSRVKRFSKSRGSGRVMIRKILVTRGSSHHDPRVVFG